MFRALFILTIIACGLPGAHAGDFPFSTPRCGQTFITFYETGRYTDQGFEDGYSYYRSVRKTDVIALFKHPGANSFFGMTLRVPEKPGFERVRVAPNSYVRIVECLQ